MSHGVKWTSEGIWHLAADETHRSTLCGLPVPNPIWVHFIGIPYEWGEPVCSECERKADEPSDESCPMTTDIQLGDLVTFNYAGVHETGRVASIIPTFPGEAPAYDVEIVERRHVFVSAGNVIGVERRLEGDDA